MSGRVFGSEVLECTGQILFSPDDHFNGEPSEETPLIAAAVLLIVHRPNTIVESR